MTQCSFSFLCNVVMAMFNTGEGVYASQERHYKTNQDLLTNIAIRYSITYVLYCRATNLQICPTVIKPSKTKVEFRLPPGGQIYTAKTASSFVHFRLFLKTGFPKREEAVCLQIRTS